MLAPVVDIIETSIKLEQDHGNYSVKYYHMTQNM